MRINKILQHLTLTLLLATTLLCTGCNNLLGNALAANATSFGLGYWLGYSSNTTTITTECFLNGDPIDCADMP